MTVEVRLSIPSIQVVTDNSNLSYESLDIFIYKDSIIEVF